MSSRTKTTSLLDKLRALINEARITCDHPNSPPAVSQSMLTKRFLKKIVHVRGLRMHLFAYGLSQEIRRYLKNRNDDDDGSTIDQLDLWPMNLRSIIGDIDRARVFVPSRGEFIELIPSAINAKETREAGEYLIIKGQDTIRVGRRLVSLAWKMR